MAKIIGKCAICGEYDTLSYEHIPPKDALNKNGVKVYSGDDAIKRYKGEQSKYIIRQQGMGKYSLCQKCNNNTGNWYAKEYSKIAKIISYWLSQDELSHGDILTFSAEQFPALEFSKQVIAMFCSIIPHNEVTRLGLDSLLLDKERKLTNEPLFDLRIYLLHSRPGHHLMVGPSVSLNMNGNAVETGCCSELSVYPFGFILNHTPEVPITFGTSIIDMLKADYGKKYKLKWDLQCLEKTSDVLPIPLLFKPLPNSELLEEK